MVNLTESLEHLDKAEFVPFRAAIAEGVDAIMLAHARVPALEPDPNKIATTSYKVIVDTLRNKLGFKGVVISDSMDMRGVTELYKGDPDPVGRASVDAVNAGVDVLMLPAHVDSAYNAILKAVKTGVIPEARIDASANRILAMKERAGLFENRVVNIDGIDAIASRKSDWEFAQDVADHSVTLVRHGAFTLPLVTAQHHARADKFTVVIFTDSIRSPLGRAFEEEVRSRRPEAQIRHVYYDDRATWETSDLLSVTKSSDYVVVAAFMTSLPGGKKMSNGRIMNVFGLSGQSAQILQDVLNSANQKTIVISFGSPYLIVGYPMIQNYVCTFSISSTSERAAVKPLFGEIQNKASLPITLPGIAPRGFAIAWQQIAFVKPQ